tara:strand:+ start:188 stop:481 length:294 start_codon:yes stop_codon:yes gene_type:complete
MKIFRVHYIYRGRNFDLKFCCKTVKVACERIGISYHEMKTYHGTGQKINEDEYFDNIKAVPYGHRAVESIGHRNEIDFEEAKKIIDEEAKKIIDEMD